MRGGELPLRSRRRDVNFSLSDGKSALAHTIMRTESSMVMLFATETYLE